MREGRYPYRAQFAGVLRLFKGMTPDEQPCRFARGVESSK